ncbi:hypothetical protein BV20DRAFT_974475 [Pilatotrama ljubarskyi]|nr:hypothetical protein BV20DRAFT_974475 [Pilatotrama ljubarskyi]
MSPTDAVSYPPAAHLAHADSASRPLPVQSQPSAIRAMSTDAAQAGEKDGRAERIRGGCIPCPNGSICYIIPIPCLCC